MGNNLSDTKQVQELFTRVHWAAEQCTSPAFVVGCLIRGGREHGAAGILSATNILSRNPEEKPTLEEMKDAAYCLMEVAEEALTQLRGLFPDIYESSVASILATVEAKQES